MNRRHAVLGLALAGTFLAAAFAPDPEGDVVQPITDSRVSVSRDTGRAGPAPLPQVLRIRPRDAEDSPEGVFTSTKWRQPVTPAARPAAPPPAVEPVTPKAPPVPFTAFGRYVENGKETVFLQQSEKTYPVTVGDTFAGDYRVETIKEGTMVLLYLPLGEEQMVTIGVAQ